MPLDIQVIFLLGRATEELKAANDYYWLTRDVWSFVEEKISTTDIAFTAHNRVTGTIFTKTDLSQRAREYINVRSAETALQQYISIFESYFLDIVTAWLEEYPQSLADKQMSFREILALRQLDAIVRSVIQRKVKEILYDRPAQWFKYLNDLVKLNSPTSEEIGRFAEAKASRDVLIHNRGIANKIYLDKAGEFSRHVEGDRLTLPPKYLQDVWTLLQKIITDISTALLSKTVPESIR